MYQIDRVMSDHDTKRMKGLKNQGPDLSSLVEQAEDLLYRWRRNEDRTTKVVMTKLHQEFCRVVSKLLDARCYDMDNMARQRTIDALYNHYALEAGKQAIGLAGGF